MGHLRFKTVCSVLLSGLRFPCGLRLSVTCGLDSMSFDVFSLLDLSTTSDILIVMIVAVRYSYSVKLR